MLIFLGYSNWKITFQLQSAISTKTKTRRQDGTDIQMWFMQTYIHWAWQFEYTCENVTLRQSCFNECQRKVNDMIMSI